MGAVCSPAAHALERLHWWTRHPSGHCPVMKPARSPPHPPPPPRVMGMSLEQPFECAGPHDRLAIDEACVTVENNSSEPVTLWAQSDECLGVSAKVVTGGEGHRTRV